MLETVWNGKPRLFLKVFQVCLQRDIHHDEIIQDNHI